MTHRSFFQGGTAKPERAMKCARHGLRYLEIQQAGGATIVTCPACNAEVIDALAKAPDTVSVQVPLPFAKGPATISVEVAAPRRQATESEVATICSYFGIAPEDLPKRG